MSEQLSNLEVESIPTIDLSREAWLEARKAGLGGSDAGAILGLNPWKTAADVWLVKTGREPDAEDNDAMYWGRRLEDLVADEYGVRTGRRVQRHNFMRRVGCMVANLDRLVVPDDGTVASYRGEVRTTRALEVKTARDSGLWADGLPAWYEAQVMHYMALHPTIQFIDVPVLFLSERKFEVFSVARRDDLIASLVEREFAWWQEHIVGGLPPDPQNEADCRSLWRRHHPGKSVQAGIDVERAIVALREAKAAAKAAEAAEEEARFLVEACMQDAETLVDVLGRPLATWKANKDGSVTDWEAVARAAGATDELIAQHTTPKAGARVLRLAKVKGEETKKGEVA